MLKGYRSFLPPPLPPELVLDRTLALRLSAADRAVGELAGVGRSLPNPHLLTNALVRREALSSRIEGTRASLSDDVREAYNYVAATEHVLAPDRRLALSLCCCGEVMRHRHGSGISTTGRRWSRSPAAHYQFEAIHPFLDGNGRVGRLLVVLLLVDWRQFPGASPGVGSQVHADARATRRETHGARGGARRAAACAPTRARGTAARRRASAGSGLP